MAETQRLYDDGRGCGPPNWCGRQQRRSLGLDQAQWRAPCDLLEWQCNRALEGNMRRIRHSFMILIAIAFVLNGWGLLQHLSMIPSHDGFIAAVLIANMLSIPV